MPLSLRKLVQRKVFREGASVAAGEVLPGGRVPGRDSGREQPRTTGRGTRRETTGGGSAGFSLRGLRLGFSGAALAALALALVCAVLWSFFMGYMVGRGQNPERGVESVAGLLLPAAPGGPGVPDGEAGRTPDGDAAGRSAADTGQGPESAAGAVPPPTADATGQAAASATSATSGTPAVAAPAGDAGSGTGAGTGAAAQAQAYPFSRPQGAGLAAWGITAPEAGQAVNQQHQGAAQGRAPGASQPAPQAAAAKAPQPAPAQGRPAAATEPQFDYLFQVAAFRGPADAERLRGRLEQAGLRSSVRPSGKVRLVLVHLRGDGGTAARLREELAAMNLGKPILLEKTPVRARKGRAARRSAS